MTEREAIEHLKTTTPTVTLTLGQRAARIVAWVCSGIAVMALIVSVYATRKAWDVSACVNNVLAERTVPTTNDNNAHISFAQSLEALISLKTVDPKAQAAAVDQFRSATALYLTVLVADQKLRDAHPLGKC